MSNERSHFESLRFQGLNTDVPHLHAVLHNFSNLDEPAKNELDQATTDRENRLKPDAAVPTSRRVGLFEDESHTRRAFGEDSPYRSLLWINLLRSKTRLTN